MGTFAGHFIPGSEFILLGIFLNLIHKAEQLTGEDAVDYAPLEMEKLESGTEPRVREGSISVKEPAVQNSHTGRETAYIRFLFAIYTSASITIGILYEGLGGVMMEKDGGFFSELGHIVMYLGFLPAGIAFGIESGMLCSSRPTHVRNAPLLSQACFSLGFFNQYLMLAAHATMKKPGADMLFHKLWSYTALFLFLVYFGSVLSKLAGLNRMARALQVACPAFLFIQGSWVILTGWIMFGGEFRTMRNADMGMEDIQSYFGLVIITSCVLQYIWIEVVSPTFASCYQRS